MNNPKKRSNRFFKLGSPLDGKLIPRDWKAAKRAPRPVLAYRKALVDSGLATDYAHATRLLTEHGKAVRAFRKAMAERKGGNA